MLVAQLVQGWELMFGIGVAVLLIGVIFLVKKSSLGKLLTFFGLTWLLAFVFYAGLAFAGLYVPGPYDPFMTPELWLRTVIIGIVILGVGLGIARYAVILSKKSKGERP